PLDVPLGRLSRSGQNRRVSLADRRDGGALLCLPAPVMHSPHEPQPDNPHANHDNPLSDGALRCPAHRASNKDTLASKIPALHDRSKRLRRPTSRADPAVMLADAPSGTFLCATP